MNRTLFVCSALGWGLALASSGCFKPPEIVMVDRATALEQQAAGSFDELERKLDRAGIEPRPVPLTPEQLAALGVKPAPIVDETELTDADRLDGFLLQHCIGEGKEGLLEDTKDSCKGGADPEEVQTLIERMNRARRQLWRWMHDQRTDVSIDDLQKRWHDNHVRDTICGGWVQSNDGKWAGKSC